MAGTGLCDICNDELPSSELKLIGPREMRAAVAHGFDPMYLGIAPGSDLSRHHPRQQSPYFAAWRQMVDADETDWALCPHCWSNIELCLARSTTARSSASMTPAAETFRCSCGHAFAQDNPDYPKFGQPIRLDRDIKCVKCKRTIIQVGPKMVAFVIVGGAVLGLVVGSIALKAIFGIESVAASIVASLVGVAAGIGFAVYARREVHGRLAFLASESARGR
jgi:hypothetical protein